MTTLAPSNPSTSTWRQVVEGSKNNPILRYSGIAASPTTATPAIAHHQEVANILCLLTNLIDSSATDQILGDRSMYPNAICEALRRIKEHKAPFILQRTPIPQPATSTASLQENLPFSQLAIDEVMIRDLLEFLEQNSILSTQTESEDVIQELNSWAGEEPVFLEPVVYGETVGKKN
jgi:hypothetical protein